MSRALIVDALDLAAKADRAQTALRRSVRNSGSAIRMPLPDVTSFTKTILVTDEIVDWFHQCANIPTVGAELFRLSYRRLNRGSPVRIGAPKVGFIKEEVETTHEMTVSQFFELLEFARDIIAFDESDLDKQGSIEVALAALPLRNIAQALTGAASDATDVPPQADAAPVIPTPARPMNRKPIKPKPRSEGSMNSVARRTLLTPEPPELEPALSAALEEVGLSGYAMVLRVSHIVTLRHLLAHSVADLEMSLKRKNGVKFSFSVVDRRLWAAVGLTPSEDAEKKPPGPKAKQCAGSLHGSAGGGDRAWLDADQGATAVADGDRVGGRTVAGGWPYASAAAQEGALRRGDEIGGG